MITKKEVKEVGGGWWFVLVLCVSVYCLSLSNTPQTPTKRIDEFMEIIKKDMLDTDRQYTDISFSQADLSADQQVGISTQRLD